MKKLERDRHENRVRLWRQLCATVYQIWLDSRAQLASLPQDGAEYRWWEAYETEKSSF